MSNVKQGLVITGLVVVGAIALHPSPVNPSTPPQLTPAATDSLSRFTPAPQSSIPDSLGISGDPGPGPDEARGVIGPDERTAVLSTSYPWSAVGRIFGVTPEDDTYICTGTLIGTDIVLTNAHCVIDPNTGELAQQVEFQPNLIEGTVSDAADIAYGVDVLYGTDFSDVEGPPHPDDWALILLDRPLGEKYGIIAMQPFDTAELAASPFEASLAMVGYSADYPETGPGETASAHVNCSITEEQDDVVYHLCDTFGGASGGPILAVIEDEIGIVALNSAQLTNRHGEGLVNYAVKIPRVIEQLEALGAM
ncbi:MAG: trypsin-like peptidase domain-containing protein [Cyanobacteria bacterium P01_D01_bin.44]